MKSTRLQLLVTLAATLIAGGVFLAKGPPPSIDLEYASCEGNLDLMRCCLRWGANVNSPHYDNGPYSMGYTPIYDATMNGKEEAVALLLSRGADPRAKDRLGKTPLHYLGGEAGLRIVRMLVDAGADPNIRNNAGVGPMQEVTKASPDGWSYVPDAEDTAFLKDLLRRHGAKE